MAALSSLSAPGGIAHNPRASQPWLNSLRPGDRVDILSGEHWVEARVVHVLGSVGVRVRLQYSPNPDRSLVVPLSPSHLAPLGTRAPEGDWRARLKVGESVRVQTRAGWWTMGRVQGMQGDLTPHSALAPYLGLRVVTNPSTGTSVLVDGAMARVNTLVVVSCETGSLEVLPIWSTRLASRSTSRATLQSSQPPPAPVPRRSGAQPDSASHFPLLLRISSSGEIFPVPSHVGDILLRSRKDGTHVRFNVAGHTYMVNAGALKQGALTFPRCVACCRFVGLCSDALVPRFYAGPHALFSLCTPFQARSGAVMKHLFFFIHRFHSISFTRAQGIPKYKIGFRREKDGRVGELCSMRVYVPLVLPLQLA